jgi:glycosyltransferase involved in cell wall biosynthesis
MNKDLIERNETNVNSKGGTELLQERLYNGSVPRELLEQFQIIPSRVRELNEDKFRILWCHDLPGDPESEVLKDSGWNKFHKIVFVSNWQMQAYINHYGIPWSHCEVIENSIDFINPSLARKKDEPVRICYTPTPHRGLHILFAAFEELCKKHDNIRLDVFSSFKLYGWEQRDEQYRYLFDKLNSHPKVTNHGTVSNDEIRTFLGRNGDIFVYPSIWPETSCLCLIEAMSAGLMCIHSNYGALPDTSAGFTYMYQFEEDENRHATKLYHLLNSAIPLVNDPDVIAKSKFMKMYADNRFNSIISAQKWSHLLSKIIAENPDKKVPEIKKMFTYVSQ